MNILEQLNKDMNKQFTDMSRQAKPITLEDIEQMAQAKADYQEGKEPKCNHPAYVEAYSIESSIDIIRSAS